MIYTEELGLVRLRIAQPAIESFAVAVLHGLFGRYVVPIHLPGIQGGTADPLPATGLCGFGTRLLLPQDNFDLFMSGPLVGPNSSVGRASYRGSQQLATMRRVVDALLERVARRFEVFSCGSDVGAAYEAIAKDGPSPPSLRWAVSEGK